VKAALLLILLAGLAAGQMTLEKSISGELRTGGKLQATLKVTNPYNQTVKGQIQDKVIIGGNGLDIQCLEVNIPPGEGQLAYDPIELFQEGTYTTGAAILKYTNPETGKEEAARTKEQDIRIEKGAGSANAQGITTIYQCNGQNMRSTSYTSQRAQQQNQQQQNQQQSQQQAQNQQQSQQQQDKMNQIHQDDQNMDAVKKQLQEQAAKKEQEKKELEQAIENSKEFQEEQKKMEENGYQQQKKDISQKMNGTGEFKYTYSNGTSQQNITGKIENNNITQIENSLETEQIKELLEKDTRYQEYKRELEKEGYANESFGYTKKDNATYAKAIFNNTIAKAWISAEIRNSTVEKVELEKERERSIFPYLLLAALALGLLMMRPKPKIEEKRAEGPIDHRALAEEALEKARKEFEGGDKAKAYQMVSKAVREYLGRTIAGEAMTSTEAIRALEGKQKKTAQKCFASCDLVKFARYKPCKKDFEEALEAGKELVESY